jgi:multidrug efflux pump subunit AcrB
VKVAGKAGHGRHQRSGHGAGGILGRGYRLVAAPILASRARAWTFLIVVGLATLGSLALLYTTDVTVKLLPFDNKTELQVVVDLPEGSSLEATDRVLNAAAGRAAGLAETVSMQTFAGTAAPFNFNGLVRHYYLRSEPQMGDVMVNLKPKGERSRSSHEIALDLRGRLAGLAMPAGTAIKVVEPPPGPPVLATLLAEIYGPDAAPRRRGQGSRGLRRGALHRRYRQLLGGAPRARAHRHRPGQSRIPQGRPGRRLRHHPGALWRPHRRLFPPRRRAPSRSHPRRPAQG